MNTLTTEDLDNLLFKQAEEEHKPTRKIIDKYVLPAGSMTVGGAMAAIKALGNIRPKDTIQTVQ